MCLAKYCYPLDGNVDDFSKFQQTSAHVCKTTGIDPAFWDACNNPPKLNNDPCSVNGGGNPLRFQKLKDTRGRYSVDPQTIGKFLSLAGIGVSLISISSAAHLARSALHA